MLKIKKFTRISNLIKNIFITCCSVCVISCATTNFANKPLWVTNSENEYSKENLTAVGMGVSVEEASKSAISNIGRIINQTIEAETVVKNYDGENSSGLQIYSSSINQVVKTTVQIDSIVGVQISQTWLDKDGTCYALATLNKAKTSMYYSQKIQDNESVIQKNIVDAKLEQNKFYAYRNLLSVLPLVEENEQNLNILYTVNKSSFASAQKSTTTVTQINSIIKEIVSNITISVVGLDDYPNLKSSFTDSFANEGFVVLKDDADYILDSQISFEESQSDKLFYSKYYFTATLKSVENENVVFSFTDTFRAAHKRAEDAKRKAILNLQKNINAKMQNINSLLEN